MMFLVKAAGCSDQPFLDKATAEAVSASRSGTVIEVSDDFLDNRFACRFVEADDGSFSAVTDLDGVDIDAMIESRKVAAHWICDVTDYAGNHLGSFKADTAAAAEQKARAEMGD